MLGVWDLVHARVPSPEQAASVQVPIVTSLLCDFNLLCPYAFNIDDEVVCPSALAHRVDFDNAASDAVTEESHCLQSQCFPSHGDLNVPCIPFGFEILPPSHPRVESILPY